MFNYNDSKIIDRSKTKVPLLTAKRMTFARRAVEQVDIETRKTRTGDDKHRYHIYYSKEQSELCLVKDILLGNKKGFDTYWFAWYDGVKIKTREMVSSVSYTIEVKKIENRAEDIILSLVKPCVLGGAYGSEIRVEKKGFEINDKQLPPMEFGKKAEIRIMTKGELSLLQKRESLAQEMVELLQRNHILDQKEPEPLRYQVFYPKNKSNICLIKTIDLRFEGKAEFDSHYTIAWNNGKELKMRQMSAISFTEKVVVKELRSDPEFITVIFGVGYPIIEEIIKQKL